MSKSIHKTTMGVFRGKPKAEISRMIAQRDDDIEALRKKAEYKSRELQQRKNKKAEGNR